MTKEKFKEMFGEDPVDVLGEDWENLVDDYVEEIKNDEFGETYG